MGFPTGDDAATVPRIEAHGQDRVISALEWTEGSKSTPSSTHLYPSLRVSGSSRQPSQSPWPGRSRVPVTPPPQVHPGKGAVPHHHLRGLRTLTLISASFVPRPQSHTDSMCSLESSTTQRKAPWSWRRGQSEGLGEPGPTGGSQSLEGQEDRLGGQVPFLRNLRREELSSP